MAEELVREENQRFVEEKKVKANTRIMENMEHGVLKFT